MRIVIVLKRHNKDAHRVLGQITTRLSNSTYCADIPERTVNNLLDKLESMDVEYIAVAFDRRESFGIRSLKTK